jgi:WD40-like Beta Propeller Repeat
MGGAIAARFKVALFVVCLAALAQAVPAHATFPGANGRIAFVRSGDIWTMNPDGSGQVNLTSDAATQEMPSWSPDGARIAYSQDSAIWIMNADGSNKTMINTGVGPENRHPAWSPDGTRIVYANWGGALWIMNSDGTGSSPLNGPSSFPQQPEWSPDGTVIAFIQGIRGYTYDLVLVKPDGTNAHGLVSGDPSTQLFGYSWAPDAHQVAFWRFDDIGGPSGLEGFFVINSDGTGIHELPAGGYTPAWSPDGKRIAFQDAATGSIRTMNPDGTAVSGALAAGSWMDWQPVPVNSYARPKGATPMRISLVTANNACTAPNRTHGAPLAFPSCAPVTLTSDQLTVGTGDSNAKPALSQPSLRLDVLPGNPATPADEADVKVSASINDVFKKDLSDYTGALRAVLPIQITDKLNTPSPGGPGAATTAPSTFQFDVACTATADTSAGSDCNLNTTFDSLVPGLVKEGVRGVWQLGQVQVYDGGADGVASTTGDNTLFMDQGVFIP